MPPLSAALGRAAALTLVAALGGTAQASAQAGRPLEGTFRILPGSCDGPQPSGSWFRMAQPGGTVANGPFFENLDSTCADQSFTLLTPGVDGGLRTGRFQQPPARAFDGTGNALANRIIAPTRFGGVDFSLATTAVERQTRRRVRAPVIRLSGRRLTGDLRALTALWNDQAFNQGTPKPSGARPGTTSQVTGTLDPATNRFTLTWSSQIEGGAFNRFTGRWRLEGRFAPRGT